jgi:hypothetical protein
MISLLHVWLYRSYSDLSLGDSTLYLYLEIVVRAVGCKLELYQVVVCVHHVLRCSLCASLTPPFPWSIHKIGAHIEA